MVGPEIKQKPDYAGVFPLGAPPRPPAEKRDSVNGQINPALTLKEEVVTLNPLFEGKVINQNDLTDHGPSEEKVIEEDLKNAHGQFSTKEKQIKQNRDRETNKQAK